MINKTTAKAFRYLHRFCPHGPKELNEKWGFDFMADFSAAVIQGPFTVQKVAAAVNPGNIAGTMVVVVKGRYFRAVEIGPEQRVFLCPLSFRLDQHEICRFDSAQDFQEAISRAGSVGIAFFQRAELLLHRDFPGIQQKREYWAPSELAGKRWKLLGWRWSYCTEPPHLAAVRLQEIGGFGEVRQHEIHCPGGILNKADFIDHSGYIVLYRRQELRERVETLRNDPLRVEKERAKYVKKAPNRTDTLQLAVERLRADLVAALAAATDKATLGIIGCILYFKLPPLMDQVESYSKSAADLEFPSISDDKKAAAAVLEEVEKTRKILKNRGK